MKTLLRLSKLILPLLPVMLLAVLFGTIGHFCAIGIPTLGALALIGSISKEIIPLWIFPVIGITRGVLHYIEQYCNHYLAFSILARIRAIVFKKLRELGPAKLETKEKGQLLSILTSDIELLEVFYAHTISPVCIATLVTVGMLVFFAKINMNLVLVALIFYCLVGIVVPVIVNKTAVKLGTIHREEYGKMNSFLYDCLRGLEQTILYSNGNKKLEQISIEQVVLAVTAMFSSFGPVLAVAALGSGLSGTIASGKSGCGKSTLLKLFMRFWKADSGEVKISNQSVNVINSDNLKAIESYVTQETVLFHDTIENNLRIAKQNATLEEIQTACKKAAIHDFIMALPEGYQTKVSELGDNFSGGERQRLGLARAFLHDGDFLILDEPTSNLDSYNEHQIMETVKKESEGKTVVIVSHRDSTFEFADKIYKLESGRLT